ncbi:MAG: hypothetical protein ACL7BU_03715 [Candidatus Phlomobacter fragariae]
MEIGNLNLTCYSHNKKLNLNQKRVTLDLYPNITKSTDKFTTNLDGLNFIFNINGKELKPNNGINNSKKITLSLNDSGKADIKVDELFKLD